MALILSSIWTVVIFVYKTFNKSSSLSYYLYNKNMNKLKLFFFFLATFSALSSFALDYTIDKDIDNWALQLIEEGRLQTTQEIKYNPAYVKINYPDGDVPSNTGVCTDVIIRAYRSALNFDFQSAINKDMKKIGFRQYPQNWGLNRPDSNIDHRRVPNMKKFLERHGEKIPLVSGHGDYSQYKPGDIVTLKLGGRVAHIGIVSNKKLIWGQDEIPQIIHHTGSGLLENDLLHPKDNIDGHYRFTQDHIDKLNL